MVWVKENGMNHSFITDHEIDSRITATRFSICFYFTIRVKGKMKNHRIRSGNTSIYIIKYFLKIPFCVSSMKVP